MSNEQGFVSASDYEAWKREHEFIQRGAQEAVAQAELVRAKKIGAIGAAGTDTARQPHDGPHGAMQGFGYDSVLMPRLVQQASAPGKMFRRSDILAIIRGQHGIAPNFHAKEALDALARIIANLED